MFMTSSIPFISFIPHSRQMFCPLKTTATTKKHWKRHSGYNKTECSKSSKQISILTDEENTKIKEKKCNTKILFALVI